MSSSSDLEPLVQPVANVLTLNAVTEETVRFSMDVAEHSNENATHAEKQRHDEQDSIRLRMDQNVLTVPSPVSADQNKIPRLRQHFHAGT